MKRKDESQEFERKMRRQEMDIKIYDTLLEEAVRIRKTVFVEEQGFQDEFDKIDSYARHLVLFDGENPIAVCRFFSE